MPVTKGFDFLIQWHLTERCNLRCRHCYQTGRSNGEMHIREVKNVIDEILEMLNIWTETYDINFSPSFNITGGEPFLRNDIFEILEYIKASGFDMYLLSNGTLINRKIAKKLSEIGIKGAQISIEGPRDIHEKIRGKGSFDSSVKGARCLLDEGIRVTLNITLSTLNIKYFMDTIDIAILLGVHRIGFSRLVPSGRGAVLLGKMIEKEDVREFYKKIFSLHVKGLDIVTGDPVASQMLSSSDNNSNDAVPVGGCAAGISGLTLLPDGTIIPCRRLPIPLGNVRRDSLREIWATSELLESMRDKAKYEGKCGTCKRWANCRGCRAIAYAYSQSKGKGNILAEDPQCFISE